ncbi:ParB N-terminal domain-containing protein [Tumebacillus algifaecis]|nr:ParB N-terminal domain-containing protein [Tumebacillus algifaecis]
MIGVLSNLHLVKADDICLHEAHESKRLHLTSEAIREEGVLRHPPLAVRMRDGRCLIIDGAHRTCALQQLGCRYIPLQLVEAHDFTLEAWHHLVPVGPWLDDLQLDPTLQFTTERPDGQPLAELVKSDGSVLYLSCGAEENRFQAWHRIVGAYSEEYRVNRLAPHASYQLDAHHVVLRYPAVRLDELETAVFAGQLMPAGVTRFSVRGRLLNLRIPLSLLFDEERAHEEWAKLCMYWSNTLRLYSEAVYLCEV